MCNSTKILTAFVIAVFLMGNSCASDTRHIEGRIIKMDFNHIEDIKHKDWIKIDQWKFNHVRTMKEGMSQDFSLPSSYIVVDSAETTGKKVGTPIENRAIGLHLAKHLNRINREELGDDAPRYKVINPPLISVQGIMKIMKTDSSVISVEVPKDYPVRIEAMPIDQ